MYLKEGVCTDHNNMKSLLPLLRFASSHSPEEPQSLQDYVSRMPDDQKAIYYLSSSDSTASSTSPYYEAFKKQGYEVLFTNEDIDDYLLTNVPDFDGKKIESAQSAKLDLQTDEMSTKLSVEEQKELCDWLKDTLDGRVTEVRATTRLVDSPSIVVNHPTATMRKLSKMHNMPLPFLPELELNTEHNIAGLLNQIRADDSHKELAHQVAHQLLDNSLIAAGIFDDANMVPRLNQLLESFLQRTTK